MSNVIGAQFRKLQSPVDGPPVRVRLVGPTSITSHGKPVVIPLKKARALLGYLVVREGSEIARTVLTGLLWGERDEEQTRGSLRQTLTELRAALGDAAHHFADRNQRNSDVGSGRGVG